MKCHENSFGELAKCRKISPLQLSDCAFVSTVPTQACSARLVLSRILTSETTNTYIRYMAEGKLCDFYEMHLNLDDNLPWNALSIRGVPSDTIDDTPELVWRLFLSSFQTSKFEIVVLLIFLTLEFAFKQILKGFLKGIDTHHCFETVSTRVRKPHEPKMTGYCKNVKLVT